MTLRELLGFNLFLQLFDGTASYFILSRGEAELNPFVSAAIDAWGLLWASDLLEGLCLCSARYIVFDWSLPTDGAASRPDLRGDSLFGSRFLSCSSFDSLRLMKGKSHEYYIDGSYGSSQRRFSSSAARLAPLPRWVYEQLPTLQPR